VPDPSLPARLARIHDLLDELAANEEDARQEILVAIEQLLEHARRRQEAATHKHHEVHARLQEQREERQRRRG